MNSRLEEALVGLGYPRESLDKVVELDFFEYLSAMEATILSHQDLVVKYKRMVLGAERLRYNYNLRYFRTPDGNVGYVNLGKKHFGLVPPAEN